MPTRHGGRASKNLSTSARRSFFLAVTWPAASTPWTWNTDLARSIPIVVVFMVDGSCSVACFNNDQPMAHRRRKQGPSTPSVQRQLVSDWAQIAQTQPGLGHD